jgi:serine/threonine-protein kinase
MLTGRPAFSGDTLASVAYQVVHAQPIAIRSSRPELPPEIERVVSRALAKKKEDRFRSVAELAVHLRWTATLPPPEMARAGGETIDSTVSLEETTAVSGLPSGMAAVIRETQSGIASGGSTVPRRAADETIRDDGRPHGVPPRRRRPLLIGGMVVVAAAIALVIALRPRAPVEHGDRASRDEARPAEPGTVVAQAPAPEGASPRVAVAAPAPAPAPVDEQDGPAPAAAPASAPASRAAAASALAPGAPRDRRPELPAAVKPAIPSHRGDVAARGANPARAERVGGTCFVTVGSYPWSDLWVDGADTGKQTPVVRLPLGCGPHKLELKRRDLKIDEVENVTLDVGSDFKRHYELKGAAIDE